MCVFVSVYQAEWVCLHLVSLFVVCHGENKRASALVCVSARAHDHMRECLRVHAATCAHVPRWEVLPSTTEPRFNWRYNNCVFISSPEITIGTVKWITILDIFPNSYLWKAPFTRGLCICDFLRRALPSMPSAPQTSDSFSPLGEGWKKGDIEERVNSWMWKAGAAKETVWQGILSLLCSSPCWSFKLLAERRNTEFVQQVLLVLLIFFCYLLQEKAQGKTDSIHKSSHLCSHLVCASNWVTHKVWIYFLSCFSLHINTQMQVVKQTLTHARFENLFCILNTEKRPIPIPRTESV